jgi:hypothetical protein
MAGARRLSGGHTVQQTLQFVAAWRMTKMTGGGRCRQVSCRPTLPEHKRPLSRGRRRSVRLSPIDLSRV